MNILKPFTLASLTVLGLLSTSISFADTYKASDFPALNKVLQGSVVNSIKETPVPGILEVVSGRRVIYMEKGGRYLFAGKLLDMQTERDLTAEKMKQLSAIPWAELPLAGAIRYVNGTPKYKVAVFTDPDCPYCKKMQTALDQLKDTEIFILPMPLDSLHPDARKKAEFAWCAKDNGVTWKKMVNGGSPGAVSCKNPVSDITAYAISRNINGTPFVVAANGTAVSGYMEKDALQKWVETNAK